jgi:hypothetical protein
MRITKKQELKHLIQTSKLVDIQTFRKVALSLNVHPSVFFSVETGKPLMSIDMIRKKMSNVLPDSAMVSLLPRSATSYLSGLLGIHVSKSLHANKTTYKTRQKELRKKAQGIRGKLRETPSLLTVEKDLIAEIDGANQDLVRLGLERLKQEQTETPDKSQSNKKLQHSIDAIQNHVQRQEKKLHETTSQLKEYKSNKGIKLMTDEKNLKIELDTIKKNLQQLDTEPKPILVHAEEYVEKGRNRGFVAVTAANAVLKKEDDAYHDHVDVVTKQIQTMKTEIDTLTKTQTVLTTKEQKKQLQTKKTEYEQLLTKSLAMSFSPLRLINTAQHHKFSKEHKDLFTVATVVMAVVAMYMAKQKQRAQLHGLATEDEDFIRDPVHDETNDETKSKYAHQLEFLDSDLHTIFVATKDGDVALLRTQLFQWKATIWGERRLLAAHLVRENGEIRDTPGEIADAILYYGNNWRSRKRGAIRRKLHRTLRRFSTPAH